MIITSRAEVVSLNVDVAASKAFAKLLEVESVEANVMVVPSVSNSPVVLCNVKDVVKDDVTVTSSNRPVPTVGAVSVVLNEVLSNKVSE